MLQKIFFATLLWAHFGHAAPAPCENLLEAASVRTTITHLLSRKMNRNVVLGLRGRYTSFSAGDLANLKALFSSFEKLGVEMDVDGIADDQGEKIVTLRLLGRGKFIIKTLLDLNTEPMIKRAQTWTAWQIIGSEAVESDSQTQWAQLSQLSDADIRERLARPIESLNLSGRTRTALHHARVQLIGGLVQLTAADLLRNPNFGRRELRDIEKALAALDLRLGMNTASD